MNTLRNLSGLLAAAAIFAAGASPTPARAADCYSIGQDVAEQNGGTLARASESSQGGRAVCVIVVLVPGKDGQRPRRMQIVVPQD